jgi:hypothetical protein
MSDRELSIQELGRLRQWERNEPDATNYDLGRVIRELDRVLSLVNAHLRCLVTGLECMHNRTEDMGCGCRNCRLWREIWDG